MRLRVLFFLMAGLLPCLMASGAPGTQPTRYAVDMTSVTAAQAVRRLAKKQGLPLAWSGAAGGRQFDLHLRNASAPELLLELCQQGWCVPRSSSSSDEVTFSAAKSPPLACLMLQDGSAMVVSSVEMKRFRNLARQSHAHSLELEAFVIPDPDHAPVSMASRIEVKRIQTVDGSEITPVSAYWQYNFDNMGGAGLRAWPVGLSANLPYDIGPIGRVEGEIRQWLPAEWARCKMDGLKPGQKGEGDGIQVSIQSMGKAYAPLTLHISGPAIAAADQYLRSLFNNGAMTVLDARQQPIPMRFNASKEGDGWTVHTSYRSVNPRFPRSAVPKPVALDIKLPVAVHEVTVPVALDVGRMLSGTANGK